MIDVLIARLERDQYDLDDPGISALERPYRRGWNAAIRRAIEVVLQELHAEQSMTLVGHDEYAARPPEAVLVAMEEIEDGDTWDLDHKFDLGGSD